MRAEAQGLNIMPKQGISEANQMALSRLKSQANVQTPWFGVNVGMNISWRFLINSEGKILFVAIDMSYLPKNYNKSASRLNRRNLALTQH